MLLPGRIRYQQCDAIPHDFFEIGYAFSVETGLGGQRFRFILCFSCVLPMDHPCRNLRVYPTPLGRPSNVTCGILVGESSGLWLPLHGFSRDFRPEEMESNRRRPCRHRILSLARLPVPPSHLYVVDFQFRHEQT